MPLLRLLLLHEPGLLLLLHESGLGLLLLHESGLGLLRLLLHESGGRRHHCLLRLPVVVALLLLLLLPVRSSLETGQGSKQGLLRVNMCAALGRGCATGRDWQRQGTCPSTAPLVSGDMGSCT